MSTFDVRPMKTEDLGAVRALLERTGTRAATGTADEDADTARAWVLTQDDRVVGHTTTIPSTIWVGGEERVFAHVIPPAIEPQVRAAVEEDAADVRLGTRSLEAHLAPGRDIGMQALVPARDWRSVERCFGLDIARTPSVLTFSLETPYPFETHAEPRGQLVPLDGFDEQERWLWDRCAGDFNLSSIRDAAWLEERFATDPYTGHLGVRDAEGVLRGHAAYRPGTGEGGRCASIVEWLVPPAETTVGDQLLAACLKRARADEARSLAAFLPSWSPWFERFQDHGARVVPTDWLLAARSTASRYDCFWLRDNWWSQPADFAVGGAPPPDLLTSF